MKAVYIDFIFYLFPAPSGPPYWRVLSYLRREERNEKEFMTMTIVQARISPAM